LPDVVGWLGLAAGLGGVIAGLSIARWRSEIGYVAIWIAALVIPLSLLPARDPRYILLVAPAFVLAAAVGLASVVRYLPALFPEWQAALLAVSLGFGFWSAARIHVPDVSGFREIAAYLQRQGRTDAVLYDGDHNGLFGFYVRALDPQFERRVARADKLLYQFGPTTTFEWIERSHVWSVDDVLNALRMRSGCRWVAIEVGDNSSWALGRRLLRQAVARPEFELVRSFPITDAGARRVDLYRMVNAVNPVAAVDLDLSSLTDRAPLHIAPITR
jgi:hypothetical protein